MLNQGQGTYPQLAGSFYNTQQMMPHDNGRNARQVPTFFGGLQNMMSASSAMTNFQGVPMGQGILNTQALASQQYGQSMGAVLGGVGTGLGVASMVGGIGTMGAGFAAGKGAVIPGLLTKTLGVLGGGAMMGAGIAAMGVVHGYKKRMSAIDDMRNALEGSRMGYGLSDPITGAMTNTAAFNLSKQMESSAAGSGFKNNDLKQVMGQASGLGMLNGMQSLGQVTKRVVDLAKASREIVELGEGISMSDAMQLQKLTQGMGISTNKFRGMSIGKNLVMAARASNMSMDQAAQVGGMGAMTYQQVGLGAASGMNAALYGNMASAGLTGVGAFSQRQLAALGGQQGVAQNLLAGQAGTMARMSDTLVMGAVKLDASGEFRMDRELLDQYVRGDRSREEMVSRGKSIGKGMSKGARARLMEKLQFSMPELRESMSDMLSPEEQMSIQARGILDLRKRTGMSHKRATHAYFQNAEQAESFLGYAENFDSVRAEHTRQLATAQQERMLRRASMAKSSSGFAKAGRAVAGAISGFGSAVMSPFTDIGDYIAGQVTQRQDEFNRGARRMQGGGPAGRTANDFDIDTFGGGLYQTRGVDENNPLERFGVKSYSELFERYGKQNIGAWERRTGQTSGVNTFMGGGIGQRVTELREGSYGMHRKILGDWTGLDFGIGAEDIYRAQAEASDQAILMGRVTRESSSHTMSDNKSRTYYAKALDRLRTIGLQAEAGGESLSGVDSTHIYPQQLLHVMAGGKHAYEIASGSDKKKMRAALGAAYNFMGNDNTSKAGVGYSAMKEKFQGAAGLEFLMGDATGGKLDTLALGNNSTLKADGLSKAMQETNISHVNMNRLVAYYSTTAAKGDGATRPAVETVLASAGLRGVNKRDLGKYRNLLNILDQGQVTDKKEKTQTALRASNIAGIGEGLYLTEGALSASKNSAMQAQLTKLDESISFTLGGGNLREDLVANLYREDGGAGVLAGLKGDAGEQGKATTFAKDTLSEARLDLTRKFKEERRALKEKYYTADHQRWRTESAKLTAKYTLDQRKMHKRRNDPVQYLLDMEEQKEAYFKEREGEEKGKRDSKYKRTGGLLDVGEDGTLSGMLQGIARSEESKAAYAKLLDSDSGAGLITAHQRIKRGYDSLTPEQKEQADKRMLREIVAAAEKQKVKIPGVDQSQSLPNLLEKIATGVDHFQRAMKKIASLSNDGKKVTFELVSGATPAKSE